MTTPTDTAAVEAMIERLKGYANHDPQTSWRSQCERDAIAILAALAEERDAAEAEAAALREALTDIGIYGCGMLNQPAAMNGPEENWLRSRIAQMEHVARAALKENHDGL